MRLHAALWVLIILGAASALLIGIIAPSLPLGLVGVVLLAFTVLQLLRGAFSDPAAPVPKRICPQCGRPVEMGWLACGPCGYSFVLQSHPSAKPYWPPSPVPLQTADASPPPQGDKAPPAAAP